MTTDAPDTTKVVAAKKAPAPRKTATPKVAKVYAPELGANNRLDHSKCGHERTPKGRSACRAEHAKTK